MTSAIEQNARQVQRPRWSSGSTAKSRYDHARRDRRRHRHDDVQLGLPRRHRAISLAVGRFGRSSDRGEEISSAALLGDHHRVDDRGHHHGRFRRPLARHRLSRRLASFVRLRIDQRRLPPGIGRSARFRLRASIRPKSRPFIGSPSPSRKRSAPRSATGPPTPGSAMTVAHWCLPPGWRRSLPFILRRMSRASFCSGRPSSYRGRSAPPSAIFSISRSATADWL